jgi:hypothetical protein
MRVNPPELDQDNTGLIDVIVTIGPGNWTIPELMSELQEKIRYATNVLINGTWAVFFTVFYDPRTNSFTITTIPARQFKILTPEDIATQLNGAWIGPSYDVNNPGYFNEVLGQLEGNSGWYTSTSPYISNALNLQPIRNVYIHSPNLGTYSTIGPRGESTIIKKVPVTSGYNEMIFNDVISPGDFLDCSRQTLKTLEFYIMDSRGRFVRLHGSDLSFSIVFSKTDSGT